MYGLNRCSCGGEAKVKYKQSLYNPASRRYWVACMSCERETLEYKDRDEAIYTWNQGVSKLYVPIKKSPCTEKTYTMCDGETFVPLRDLVEWENKQFHDAHYLGNVQPIELMQEQFTAEEFRGYLKGNIVKYASRLGKKDDPQKEADKILRYAGWLNEFVRGKKITVEK